MDDIKILFIGDVNGKPGRKIIREFLPTLKEEYKPDATIANGENAAGGFGITKDIMEEIFSIGVDYITTGNHVWNKKEVLEIINDARLLRPANYPEGVAGTGEVIVKINEKYSMGIINLMGRVFMSTLDCPFKKALNIVERMRKTTNMIVVDFHAEATSEKSALGWYLDGKVSAVIGTHTHVQTADERILPGGTAFITDTGMTGPMDSVIGIKKEIAINRFLYQTPQKFEISKDNLCFNGVSITIDSATGKAKNIQRIQRKLQM